MADQLDTTREGVSEQPPVAEQQPEEQPEEPRQQPEGEPQPQRPRTKHEEVMEAARANRRAQLEQETGEKFSTDADPDADVPEPAPAEGGGGEPQQPQAQQQTPPTPQPQPAAPQTVRVKVDGQEIDVSLDDLVKSYGLDRSSHQRFQAAANLFQQAQQLRQGGQPQPQPNSPAQATAPASAVPPEQPAAAIPQEDVAKVIEAIQYGSKEDAAKQLADLIGKASQGRQAATPDEIAQQVAQRVAPQVLQTVEYNEALRQIGAEATDILQHDILAQTAGNLARQIRARDVQQGTIRPWIEVFREATSQTRQKVQAFAPGFAAPAQLQPQPAPTGTGAPTTQAQRLANKEALTPTPSAASARATVGTPPPQPKTPSQIVADMQRARGR